MARKDLTRERHVLEEHQEFSKDYVAFSKKVRPRISAIMNECKTKIERVARLARAIVHIVFASYMDKKMPNKNCEIPFEQDARALTPPGFNLLM